MITWLEVPKNFNLITGKAAAGSVVAGTKLKKTDAYQLLAEYVNEHEKLIGEYLWDMNSAKSRYSALLTNYKNAKKQFEDVTGGKFCVREEEMRAGLNSKKKNCCRCAPDIMLWINCSEVDRTLIPLIFLNQK